MATDSQLCNLAGCVIDSIKKQRGELSVFPHSKQVSAECPTCGEQTTRIHSYYTRRPRDLPITELNVRLILRVRRYRCLNDACPKQTFAERLPELVPVNAQRTARLTQMCFNHHSRSQMLSG